MVGKETLPLSVKGHADYLLKEATSEQNLARMYETYSANKLIAIHHFFENSVSYFVSMPQVYRLDVLAVGNILVP